MRIPDHWVKIDQVSRPKMRIVHVVVADLLLPNFGEKHAVEQRRVFPFEIRADFHKRNSFPDTMLREPVRVELGRVYSDFMLCLPSGDTFQEESFRSAVFGQLWNNDSYVKHGGSLSIRTYRSRDRPDVSLNHLFRGTDHSYSVAFDPHHSVTQTSHIFHGVRNENHCHAVLLEVLERLRALLLEGQVSDCQDLVDK